MHISLKIARARWSHLDLWVDAKHLTFSITHIFNPFLDEIVAALVALERGGSTARFSLLDEPGRAEWVMTDDKKNGRGVNVEILMYHEIFGGSSYEEFNFIVDRYFFIDSFIAEFDKITTQFEYADFAEEREPEKFPWKELRELKMEVKKRDKRKAAH